MSLNWIEAYYWQSREQNPASTPGHAAPLVKSDSSNYAQNSMEQGLAFVQKKTPEQPPPILQNLKNSQRASDMDDTGMSAIIADQTESP